ncbi:hypothetical protein [Streptomyces sp. NRRL S-146]|uniref:hypothetical protein n=1 Tax=Streptomyces sp. NRRL S-146 TaxID=1463884 RepID=UPI00131ACA01|nr:hypothetical protein [Streptomyces sp. NRRL S-146]
MTVTDQHTAALTEDERTALRELIEGQQESQPEPEPFGPVLRDLRTSALETEVDFQAILKAKNRTADRRRRTLYLMWRETKDVRQVAAMLPSTVTMHTVIAAVLQCASRQDFEELARGTAE